MKELIHANPDLLITVVGIGGCGCNTINMLYENNLSDKVNLIAHSLLAEENLLKNEPLRDANLSASGIGFECEEQLTVGSVVAIKFLLESSMKIIECHVRVIECYKSAEPMLFPYFSGFEYIDIQEEDVELLIKHVVKQQMHTFRSHKNDAESSSE